MMLRITFFLLLAFTSLFGMSQGSVQEAQNLYEEGNFEACTQMLTILIAQEKTPDALKLRGDAWQKMGRLSDALDDYDRAKIAGYNNTELYLNRGICKLSLNLYEGAKLDLVNFIEKNPEDARGYYWMGTAEYMNMENKASIRYLDEAIYLDSTYADAFFLRAANYIEQGKTTLAFDDFNEAFALNPKLHRAKLSMAMIYIDVGRYRSATELLSELKLEQIDFVAEVLYYRGEARFLMHDLEGACMDWNEASSYGDVDALANYERLCVDRSGKPKFKRRIYMQF